MHGIWLARVIIDTTNFNPPKNKLHSPTDFTANQPYNAMEASASPVAKTRELFLHQQPLGTMARKFKFCPKIYLYFVIFPPKQSGIDPHKNDNNAQGN